MTAINILLVIVGVLIFVYFSFIRKYNKKEEESNGRFFEMLYHYHSDSEEWGILTYQNERRVLFDLNILLGHELLTVLAKQRCGELEMEYRHTGKISHSGVSDEFIQMEKAGTDSEGENIAFGYQTVEAVINAWIKSPEHDRNILNEDYDWVGIATLKTEDGLIFRCVIFAGDDEFQKQ